MIQIFNLIVTTDTFQNNLFLWKALGNHGLINSILAVTATVNFTGPLSTAMHFAQVLCLQIFRQQLSLDFEMHFVQKVVCFFKIGNLIINNFQ